MPAASARAAEIKDANVRYHDVAAATYDAKWGIDLGEVGQRQVRAKLAKALGRRVDRPFGDALELATARAEAEELPFADSSFDLVFGHAVLHHIPDPKRAFGEFARVLRPG